MAYGGVRVYLCGNRHGQCFLIANVSPEQTIKKGSTEGRLKCVEKASKLLSQS